jgi:hypothetical protein
MRRLVIAGLLVVLSVSGCASMKGTSTSEGPPVASGSIPPPAAAPPGKAESSTSNGSDKSSPPAPPPVSPATRPSPAKAKSSTDPRLVKQTGAAAAQTRPPVLPPSPAPSPPSPTSSPIASPTLNLADLEQRLRETRAIGVFTKLSLKNQVDDLLNAFRALYRGPDKHPPVELRQRYDLLLLKVLTLLQDGDPPLAAAISSSREAIWSILADPDKFAKI